MPHPVEDYIKAAKRAQKEARPDDLVANHLRLAIKIAHEFRGRGMKFEDLLAEANLALVHAAHDYPRSEAKEKGRPFVWYAARAIRTRLLTAVRRNSTLLHIPQKPWEAMSACRRAAARLRLRHPDQEPTEEEIAQEAGLPIEEVKLLHRLLRVKDAMERLDEPLNSSDKDPDTLADTIASEEDVAEEVAERLDAERRRQAVVGMVDALPPKSRLAVSLRFGIETPSVQELALEDVLHAALNMTGNAQAALRRFRKGVPDEIRPDDAPTETVVSDRGGPAFRSPYAPCGIATEERRERVADFWRRYTGDGKPAAVDAP